MKTKPATYFLAKWLLDGNDVSNKTSMDLFSMSNCPREISRCIEKKFSVRCERKKIDFTSRFGHDGYYFSYTLKKTKENKEGIKLMRKYIASYE